MRLIRMVIVFVYNSCIKSNNPILPSCLFLLFAATSAVQQSQYRVNQNEYIYINFVRTPPGGKHPDQYCKHK